MTNFLFRVAVIGLVLFLFKTSTDKGQKAFDRAVNWGRGVMVGADLSTFSKEINTEYAFSGNWPRDFPAWIRENAKRNDGSDPAADPWGQTIRFTVPRNAPAGTFELRSCGPDRKCDTPDDLVHRERAAKFD